MKLFTVVVYDLRMCMKEDNLCLKNIKGDNSREIIIFAEPWVPFVLRPTVLVYQGETTHRQLQLYRDG